MLRRNVNLLGAIAFWGTTTLSMTTTLAQEVVVAPILGHADGTPVELSADKPMIRIAAVPQEKNDPFKPAPPAEEPKGEVVPPAEQDEKSGETAGDAAPGEDAPAEKSEQKSQNAEAKPDPSKAMDVPADALKSEEKEEEPGKPAEAESRQPAPLMQDKDAKPIKEEGAEAEKKATKPADSVTEDEPQVEKPLPPEVRSLQPRIARVLNYYYRAQPSDATKDDVWETMHGFLPWGVDALIRTSQYRQPVSTIGWICWNKPCRGHRLFEIKNGKLEARQGPRVQGHHGQFLAMLAQSYVPASFEIQVDGQSFTVADLIEFEKETCQPKSELTFKLISLSYYLPADAKWTSRDGQEWSLERLLKEEITQKVVGAACGGTHRLTGIAFAVSSRKKAGLPMDGVWAKAEEYINAYHQHSFQIQNPDGSFSTNWFEGRGMDRDVDRRIQTSGHILEFLIFSLPPEELTSPEIVRAVNYITTILERNPKHEWSIGPKGHALHALVLYDQLVFGTKPGSRTAEILQASHD
ncbi:hypothetical protein Pan97_19650 [Bremerella volcania]|uniref:Uncharacterized protein n=1 Tax=Bremerella volcania TaxID=2527984 RepID=A0A518C6U1_9BACT|nr:hypothetical protein [Bremerella volcania]QDU74945.1 hypothetical protein Pan97_19650 [Bremerella volcania]